MVVGTLVPCANRQHHTNGCFTREGGRQVRGATNAEPVSIQAHELVRMVQSGPWAARGKPVRERTLVARSAEGLVTSIATIEGSEQRLAVTVAIAASDARVRRDVTFTLDVPVSSIVRTEPWQYEVRTTRLVREQRKKDDGGGWHEVPRESCALVLVDTQGRQDAHQRARDAWNAARAREHARALERHRRYVQQTNMLLAEQLVGKTITRVAIVSHPPDEAGFFGMRGEPSSTTGGVFLTFADGTHLLVPRDADPDAVPGDDEIDIEAQIKVASDNALHNDDDCGDPE